MAQRIYATINDLVILEKRFKELYQEQIDELNLLRYTFHTPPEDEEKKRLREAYLVESTNMVKRALERIESRWYIHAVHFAEATKITSDYDG